VMAEVLRRFGGGIAAPSANRFGRVSPTTAQHVLDELGEVLDPERDAILDGGPCEVGVESTIVDCTGAVPIILRPGGVSAERIEEVLGMAVQRRATGPSRAPGMLDAHYAPRATVVLVASVEPLPAPLPGGGRVGALCPPSMAVPPTVVRLDSPDPYTASALAPVLYARLRQADDLGLDVLLVVPPDDDGGGLGTAVRDRLRRAATGSARG
jgi:L-threonylcarbamoyladenylate synthase